MENITVIVETPKGSSQKYTFNEEKKWFELKKILPAGMAFPFDFGFIPETKGEDGDPLDVIVIAEFGSFPGCVLQCKIIGAIAAEQEKDGEMIRNDRFIAVSEVSNVFANVTSIEDLPEKLIEHLEEFFVNYNNTFKRQFKPIKKLNAPEALTLLKKAK